MLHLLWVAAMIGTTAVAQERDPARDTPLDTQPLATSSVDSVDAVDADGVVDVETGLETESFFAFDPYARGRGLVVSTTDVILACAGAGPLRDAALACPIDHQLSLRGLPGLLEACSAIGRGGMVPTTATSIPHAATIKAAADARAASSARMVQDCAFQLSASREGAELQVAVPAASGVVEVRVGWRPQPQRHRPGDPLPAVRWLPPVYQPAVAARPEDVSRTVDLGAIRPSRGWWRFDLAVEVLDEAGAATRVIMPVDIAETGVAGSVELGPSLEVSVGTGSANLSLADLPIPPETDRAAMVSQGQPGVDRTPVAGAGSDLIATDMILDACASRPMGLASTTCRRLRGPAGEPAWPPAGAGPIVGAAARDDLVGLLRRQGELLLQWQSKLPVSERKWMTEDAGLVVAALGGMLETMVQGSDPIAALATWAQQRPPTFPSGEPFGFFVDDTHRAAPLASTLYVASLVAASTPEPVPGPSQSGVGILTLASNLAWPQNLPGGLRAAWSGTVHPKLGTADLGWLTSVAVAVDDIRSSIAGRWERLRRGGPEVVSALAGLYGQTTTAVLAAAAQIPDQAGATREVRAARRALLDRLLGQVPDIYSRMARGDMSGSANASVALLDEPGLREALPSISREELTTIGALATLSSPDAVGRSSSVRRAGLVGVVGLGAGPELGPGGVGVVVVPTAAVAWQRRVLRGRATGVLQVPLLDVGAPWAWRPSADAPMEVDWRAVVSPGVQLGWSPTPRALVLSMGVRAAPTIDLEDRSGASAVRFVVGVSHAMDLMR